MNGRSTVPAKSIQITSVKQESVGAFKNNCGTAQVLRTGPGLARGVWTAGFVSEIRTSMPVILGRYEYHNACLWVCFAAPEDPLLIVSRTSKNAAGCCGLEVILRKVPLHPIIPCRDELLIAVHRF
jgi:hypothetical protein